MKKLLLVWIFSGSLDSFSQVKITTLPGTGEIIQPVFKLPVEPKPDTVCEWMHLSCTRGKGFVIARKALAVRQNGYCITHLDCDKKPFPVHYKVGWCEGKEALFNRLVSQLK